MNWLHRIYNIITHVVCLLGKIWACDTIIAINFHTILTQFNFVINLTCCLLLLRSLVQRFITDTFKTSYSDLVLFIYTKQKTHHHIYILWYITCLSLLSEQAKYNEHIMFPFVYHRIFLFISLIEKLDDIKQFAGPDFLITFIIVSLVDLQEIYLSSSLLDIHLNYFICVRTGLA